MPTDPANVCLPGKTGSERHAVKVTRLTHFGHRPCGGPTELERCACRYHASRKSRNMLPNCPVISVQGLSCALGVDREISSSSSFMSAGTSAKRGVLK